MLEDFLRGNAVNFFCLLLNQVLLKGKYIIGFHILLAFDTQPVKSPMTSWMMSNQRLVVLKWTRNI